MPYAPRKHVKAKALFDPLREIALSKGPNARFPSRDELCRMFGTSPATLHNALAELEAQNIIYRRKGSGIYVSPKLNCKNIEVLINATLVDRPFVSPFWGILWGNLVREGQNRSEHKNEEIHFRLTSSDPVSTDSLLPEILRSVELGRVHGVITIGMNEPSTPWAVTPDLPLVAYAGPGHWQVGSDETHIINEVVRRLVLRGCRNIGYWSYCEVQNAGAMDEAAMWLQRLDVFKSALAVNNLPFRPELYRIGSVALSEASGDLAKSVHAISPETAQDQGYSSALRTFSDAAVTRPDAVVITDDMLTSGALAALHGLRIRPGEDLVIASHSNAGSPVLGKWEQYLVLWETDPAELVATMFDLLDRLMAGEPPEVHQIYVPMRMRE